MLPNKLHLLIEGGTLEQVVEVYQIDADVGELTEPIHVIQTGCRGLDAIETSEDKIFMGFRGTLMEGTCRIQIYDLESYELVR